MTLYKIIYYHYHSRVSCVFSGRTGLVDAESFKIGLVGLCQASLEEKYRCKFVVFS